MKTIYTPFCLNVEVAGGNDVISTSTPLPTIDPSTTPTIPTPTIPTEHDNGFTDIDGLV